jgi:nucleoside-diphosphate-sugar epimerase
MSDRVLITGASGFVGGAVARELVERGCEVLALARSDASAERVESSGATVVRGDVTDPASLGSLPADLDVVVHLAATPILRPGTPPRRSAFEAVRSSRIEGTRNLVRAVERAAAPRLLVSASAAAYPAGTEKHDEASPLWTDNAYGSFIPEWEAAAESDSFPSVRLRIPPLYGPTDEGGLGAVFLPALRKGKGPKVIGNPELPGSYLHLADAVRAIVACIERCDESDTLNLADDAPVTPMAFARAASEAFGAKAPGKIPAFAVRLIVGKDLLELIRVPPAVDNGRLRERTGWEPRYPDAASGWRAIAEALAPRR